MHLIVQLLSQVHGYPASVQLHAHAYACALVRMYFLARTCMCTHVHTHTFTHTHTHARMHARTRVVMRPLSIGSQSVVGHASPHVIVVDDPTCTNPVNAGLRLLEKSLRHQTR